MPAAKTAEQKRRARVKAKTRKPRPKPTEAEVLSSLRKIDAKDLTCHELRSHAWDKKGYYRNSDGLIVRVLQCLRCKSVGIDLLTKTYKRAKPRRYQYRDGYRIGSVQPEEYRAEGFKRAKVFRSEKQMMDTVFKNGNGKK